MTRRRPAPRSLVAKFKRDVRELRDRCPPLLPVRVYRRKLEDCLGTTSVTYDEKGYVRGFVIVVADNISWDATWQILVHEWAHTLAWHEGHETVDDHGPEWALALARVYQETVEP